MKFDPSIVFQEHPIEKLSKKLFQKIDNIYVPTAKFKLEEYKYDITILDIGFCKDDMQSDFTIEGTFSQENYQSALLLKLGSYPRSVQRDFLKYQIAALTKPIEWLQALEQIVEINLRLSPMDGNNLYWEPRLKHVSGLIEKCITDIEDQITHPVLEALKTQFSVEELALLFRGMAEEGLIEVPYPKTKLFKWISQCFSTKEKLNPSDLNIKNLFNNPTSKTVKSLHIKLISLADKISKDL